MEDSSSSSEQFVRMESFPVDICTKMNTEVRKKCSVESCAFSARNNSHLKYHMLIKHGVGKKYKCPSCEYTCANRSMLNSHLKRHSLERPFSCETCGSSYTFSNLLKKNFSKLSTHDQQTEKLETINEIFGLIKIVEERKKKNKTKKIKKQIKSSGLIELTHFNVRPFIEEERFDEHELKYKSADFSDCDMWMNEMEIVGEVDDNYMEIDEPQVFDHYSVFDDDENFQFD